MHLSLYLFVVGSLFFQLQFYPVSSSAHVEYKEPYRNNVNRVHIKEPYRNNMKNLTKSQIQ